ncbi:MAG: amidohydrolase family protein [bacterium]
MAQDLFIRNARLRGRDGLFDIAVRGGKVEKITPVGDGSGAEADSGASAGGAGADAAGASGTTAAGARTWDRPDREGGTIDAKGNLVTEPFVNGHLHLDKVYTLERLGGEALKAYQSSGMGGAMTAIELAAAVKNDYDQSWIVPNVRRAVERAVSFGNTHIRAFADVDTTGKLEGVKALLQVRDEMKDVCTLEVVAFPQDGVIRDPGAEDYVKQALDLGADCVGGIPWIELTDADARDHIDRMMALAVKYNRDVSMLVDDTGDPNLRTLEMLAVKTIEVGWEGRVTAQHARAMATYPEPTFRRLVGLLKKAQVSVVSDPQTGPLHARVSDLRAAGVPVALGQDDCADAYYPFGRNNMLEVGFLASHLLWMTSFEDLEAIYDMLTKDAAKALGIDDYGLTEGAAANLVILPQPTVWEALWEHEAPAFVVREGRIIAEA